MSQIPSFDYNPPESATGSVRKKSSVKRVNDFRAVAENVPDIICRFDREFRLAYVNPAIESATGVKPQVFIGKSPLAVGMPKEFVEYWNKHVDYVFTTGNRTTLEFIFPTPQGERYYQSLVVPEFDEEGSVESVLSISRDITAIKKIEKQKDEFISLASHELKTPLTSLRIFTQLFEKRMRLGKTKKEEVYFVKNIITQTERLSKLVEDLLNVGRIESGKLNLTRKSFDLMELIRKTVITFQYSIDTHNIVLSGNISRSVIGDEEKIEQVLVNLITNAVKYSPESDKINIMVHEKEREAVVHIRDFGFGIAKDEQDKIFERFYRSTDTDKVRVSGFGLGLYISKEIIERHNGTLRLESTPGKGSVFSFTLPLAG